MAENEWVTGTIRVSIAGHPLEMSMTVPAKPIKPHRMLPVFHQMTNSFVGLSVEAATAEGEAVSCKAGCGACCRQPVPLAEVEVYQLAELVEAMPEPKKSEIKERFSASADHFRKIGWFDRVGRFSELARTEPEETVAEEVKNAVHQYMDERIPCPFLEEESCTIHESRPIACREYLVTSPAENCYDPTAATVKKVDMIMEPSKILKHLGTTGSFANAGLLPLVRALELADNVPEHFVEKTGERWVADFFGIMTRSEIPKKGIKAKPKSNRKPRKKRR